MEIQIQDVLTLKKPHPCGSFQFEVKRVGIDIGIKCLTCGHYVLVPKKKLIKKIKKIN